MSLKSALVGRIMNQTTVIKKLNQWRADSENDEQSGQTIDPGAQMIGTLFNVTRQPLNRLWLVQN